MDSSWPAAMILLVHFQRLLCCSSLRSTVSSCRCATPAAFNLKEHLACTGGLSKLWLQCTGLCYQCRWKDLGLCYRCRWKDLCGCENTRVPSPPIIQCMRSRVHVCFSHPYPTPEYPQSVPGVPPHAQPQSATPECLWSAVSQRCPTPKNSKSTGGDVRRKKTLFSCVCLGSRTPGRSRPAQGLSSSFRRQFHHCERARVLRMTRRQGQGTRIMVVLRAWTGSTHCRLYFRELRFQRQAETGTESGERMDFGVRGMVMATEEICRTVQTDGQIDDVMLNGRM